MNHSMDADFYIKTNQIHYTLFSLLFHFTPTCFDVWNVIFREYTEVFTSAGRLVMLLVCFILLLRGCNEHSNG
jgi:hypothetical protein